MNNSQNSHDNFSFMIEQEIEEHTAYNLPSVHLAPSIFKN